MTTTFRRVLTTAAALVFLSMACASSEPKSDFDLAVNDDEIMVAVSKSMAQGVIEGLVGADLDCKSEIDGGMEALLTKLDRGGPRSHATYRDGETRIDATRRGGKLDLDIRGEGSGRIEATMPWAVAQCLLGQNTSIDRTLTSSVKVKVTNEDGRNFSFRLQ